MLQKPGQLLGNLNRSVQRRATSRERNASVGTTDRSPEGPAPRGHPELVAGANARFAPRSRPDVDAYHPGRPDSAASPSSPSDDELAEDVIGRLRTQKERGTLRNFDVDVQVNDRVVWVSGRVASEEQQSLVLDITRRVRGVKQVVNDLQVTSQAPIQVVSAPVVAAAPAMAPPSQVPAPVGPAGHARPKYPHRSHTLRRKVVPMATRQVPLAFAPAQSVAYMQPINGQPMAEVPAAAGIARARFDNPAMPGYAWPSYAAYPNYAAVTYPRQYSPTAWPYIGPFYPYPQVPLGWRKVTMEWDDGWWWLDFKSK